MNKLFRFMFVGLAVLALVLFVACGDDDDDDDGNGEATTPAGEATTPAGAETEEPTDQAEVNLTAVHGSSPDFIAIPTLAAWDILAEEGINVKQIYVEDGPTAVQTVVRGDAQIITNVAANAGVLAIEEGANIKMLAAPQLMTWSLASTPDIETIPELDGKEIAVHSETSFTRTVAESFAREYDMSPNIIYVPGSEVRAQALANGEIDATIIDLSDIARLEQVAPGSFNILATLGETLGDILSAPMFIDSEWAEENPDIAVKVAEAVILGLRKLNDDPDYALQLAQEALPEEDPAVLETLVNQYIERGLWPPNGVMNEETANATLQFYFENDQIDVDPATADLSKYHAFDLLNQALDNVGRE